MRCLLGAVLLLCAACAQSADQTEAIPPRPVPVSSAEAAELFAKICLDTAPDFVAARSRMESAGLTDIRRNGVRYDATGTVSAKVQTRSEPRGITVERCSVVFEDLNNTNVSDMLVDALTERAIATDPAREGGIGSRIAQIWDVRIDGRRARVIFVPARSELLPGGIYFDIPARNAAA